MAWFGAKKRQGKAVSARLMRSKAREFAIRTYGDEAAAFKASHGWFRRFMSRHNLVWRRRNDNAKASAEELAPAVAMFINRIRALRMSRPDDDDLRFGQFGPQRTYDVDQVPLPFASTNTRTLEYAGTKRVWIKGAGSGLEKRQCTLQLLIRAEGRQPKPCLIFRGNPSPKGHHLKLREEEAKHYDEDVRVMWQRKAWADTDTCVAWAETVLEECIEDDLEDKAVNMLLFCDNLNGQVAEPFKNVFREWGATLQFGPKNATHMWQPVDHHVGARYKYLIAKAYDEFMLTEFDTFAGGKVPVRKRRQLLTEWCGAAYRQLEAERRRCEEACHLDPTSPRSLFYRAFQRTGCLVTADGSGDADIIPNQHMKDGLLERFRSLLRTPAQLQADAAAAAAPAEEFLIPILTDTDPEDSTDEDDEPPEVPEDSESDVTDDGEREPLPGDMEMAVASEADQIRAAQNQVIEDGNAIQLADFKTAKNIAQQFGIVDYQDVHVKGRTTRYGRKRKVRISDSHM
jgi:hypothetical protein